MAVQRGRLKLLLIGLLFVLPFAAAQLAYRYWQPDKFANYGELLEPAAFPAAGLRDAHGAQFDMAALGGKWVLLLLVPGECDAACRRNLYLMRQVRLAMGREQHGVERLAVLSSPLQATLAAEHAGLRQALLADAAAWARLLPPGKASGGVFLLDPLGRYVLRFPEQADGKRMIKDLQRLLKYARVG